MANNIETMKAYSNGSCGIELLSNGAFFYTLHGRRVQWVHSSAQASDGRKINTRTAVMGKTLCIEVVTDIGPVLRVTTEFSENGLRLVQTVDLPENAEHLLVQVTLSDVNGQSISTNCLSPIDTPYPSPDGEPLLLSLDQRMLLVPYDNDMWVRYESAPLRPGRRSYDVTAQFDPVSRNGLVIGAVDFDVWKNGITCSAYDARCLIATSGIADAGTHDYIPHGLVSGIAVSSARFMMLWSGDVRKGMETYGQVCSQVLPPMRWDGHVPFGYNTYSAFGGSATMPSWQAAGDLIHALPSYGDEDGVTYINLDACANLDEQGVRRMVKDFHARGQRCGTYGAPMITHPLWGYDRPLMGTNGLCFKDLILKDDNSQPLPTPDGLTALDVTHPAWEEHTRLWLRHVFDMGFDYLKLDFLGHGSMEGAHADPACATGRMALNHAYQIIRDEFEHAGRPVFLSLSIAPLFPHGFGHARRACCDSFGHVEDVRYVLNALTFGWWTNRILYHFADPDHITLFCSKVDGRGEITENEARSRYNAAAISGTVMLLSDNFGPDGDPDTIRRCRERVARIADQPAINAIARSGIAFRPVELTDEKMAVFTAVIEGQTHAAFFNFTAEPQTVRVSAIRAGLPQTGLVTDLNRNQTWRYADVLNVPLAPCDSAILAWEN